MSGTRSVSSKKRLFFLPPFLLSWWINVEKLGMTPTNTYHALSLSLSLSLRALQTSRGWLPVSLAWPYPSSCSAGSSACWAAVRSMIWCSMSLDFSSSWEVSCTLRKEHYPDAPQRGSKVFVNERVVKWCIREEMKMGCCRVWLVLGFFFFLSGRDMLHNLPLHMCGRDQLWTVPLPSLHVWDTRGHQPRLWLVHVLCVGWTGPYVAGWFPVYARSFPLPSTHPCGAQATAGERLRVTGRRTSNRHLSHPETVTSPVPETVFTQGLRAERAFTQPGTEKAQDTSSRSHENEKEVTFDWRRFQFLWCFFSVPLYEWSVQCYCLLFKRRIVIQIFSSCKVC